MAYLDYVFKIEQISELICSTANVLPLNILMGRNLLIYACGTWFVLVGFTRHPHCIVRIASQIFRKCVNQIKTVV